MIWSIPRRPFKALLWLCALTIAIAAADRLLDVRHGLNAVYFAESPRWEGLASTVEVDPLPSTSSLKQRQPDFEKYPFSVEWRGFIVVFRGGLYTFTTVSDDGAWLYVRGQPVVDSPGPHGPIEARGTITLDAGVHPLLIRYFQAGGDLAFETRWARAGDALAPLPASALLLEAVSYRRLLGQRAASVALRVLAIVWLFAGVMASREAWKKPARRIVQAYRQAHPALAPVIVLSLLLNVCGIWWALPNTRGWAPDELVPADVLAGLRVFFSHGWHAKYPPFHYAVLSVAYTPMWFLSWLGLVNLQTIGSYAGFFFIGRFITLALGIGTLIVVYLCGRDLYGSRGGVFAALTTALMVPFAYYGKLTNLDVPYLFWFALSLLAYIRILDRHGPRDYLLFAVSAALAVCTKDQAYGLFGLTVMAIAAARWRRAKDSQGSVVRNLFDRTTMFAVGAGMAVFLVADNLIFNLGGFVEHFRQVIGPASADYQQFPGTLGGQGRMAWAAVQELRYIFGWPLTVIIAIAVVQGVLRKTTSPSLRWLLIPALSYYVTFIGVVLYFFDRFLMPIGVVLSLFAGWWLDRFVAPAAPGRRWRLALVSAAFAYSAISVAIVDYALTTDSRYTITRWLRAHAAPGQVVAARGPLELFAVENGFTSAWVQSMKDVETIRPSFIVLNPDQIGILPPAHPVRLMHDALISGGAGYQLALRYRTPPLKWPGRHPDLGETARPNELSSLGLINPTLEVFERRQSSGS